MKTLVVGIGSPILADDGVGIHAARAVKEALGDAVDVAEVGTGGLALLDVIEGYDRLILIDAIVTGAKPGTIHELTEDEVAKTAHLGAGHDADLPTALAMGRRTLGDGMPREVIVLGVEAEDLTSFSEVLAAEVEATLPCVVDCVRAMVSG